MELAFLSPLVERPGPWASVYFDTTRASQSAAAEQDLAAREACDELSRQGADAHTCGAVYDVLRELPRTGARGQAGPGAPGQALFATEGEVVLSVPLGEALESGPEVTWSPLPHLSPLLEHHGENPSCLVAYIDRTGADFELRDDLGRASAGTRQGTQWPMHRTSSADWGERHWQLSVENTWEHNAGEIADALRECWEESGAEMILLVGDARERRAVHDRLPEPLRSRAAEAEHSGRARGARTGLLDDEVARARADRVREHLAEALDHFRAGRAQAAGSNVVHDAAEGVPALVEAAREHRIASLILRDDGPDLHREVWVGREPDQIAVRRSDIQYLGDTEPIPARADDALLRAAVATGAEALTVHRPEDVDGDLPAGGLGALLRWPAGEGERLEETR
ncbi:MULTISPECIES: Vms1/Ankzf1 family peptidyl-tRNA hydrolase [Streptomyces]|uniref:Peptide chain release factor 1 n=1 Tax=Streptomyces lycii TaxID=2654337 RepID=A0ABQ7FD53_9ACTN|nr:MULTISPECIES: Vms1/Ankzf1 family peptidyl-tRNA hydrolase [Streptomyces]KAF4406517.1 hypothetical protein GCU69_24545 [Streptomyces lycii]PGH47809.1 hypothetical protein CRI70_26455 [Streptomyces sp. Ru87]